MCLLPALLALCVTQQASPEVEAAIALGLEEVRASRGIDPETSPDVDIEAEYPGHLERCRRIEQELARLQQHEWAGTYHEGDGLGWNVLLTIAPEGGATYTVRGCLGVYDLNHGEITSVSPDGIDLELELPPEANDSLFRFGVLRPYVSSRWIPVQWGDERFMIPGCQMIGFCNAVNARNPRMPYPRRRRRIDMHGGFELPRSRPHVPPAYEPFLLDEPLVVEIAACSEPKEVVARGGGQGVWFLSTATVELGFADGLLPGMLLHALPPAVGAGVVVDTRARQASVEFRCPVRWSPRVGWRLSTRPDGRD